MEKSKTPTQRFADAKREFSVLLKKSSNPFFKSKYADLNSLMETVEEPLMNHGLIILQPIMEGKLFTNIVDVETEKIVFFSELELPKLNDPQKVGSAITYFRRYTLQSLLGINAQDDDGNHAAKKENKESKPELTPENTEVWGNAVTYLKNGNTINGILKSWILSDENKKKLQNA